MQLPRGDQYNLAIQSPRIAFADSDLQNGTVETTPLGLPKPYSGGFTITYKIRKGHQSWAVRCFHRSINELQKRYDAINDFRLHTQSSYFVEARYLRDGIKVNGQNFPIIKMLWLEGEPLNVYLSSCFRNKLKIDNLISDFVKLMSELEGHNVAHGDLQHGNIIVYNDKLFLIDYDGMYLPQLDGLPTNEIGHINYQHPKRTAAHYNAKIDRFSSIVIYLGLKAISLKPELWTKFDNGENILFRSKDYGDLSKSDLINELKSISGMTSLVESFINCCYLDFDKIPSLNNFISGTFNTQKSSALGTIPINRRQYKVLSAENKQLLLNHFGNKVEVVGKLSENHSGRTSSNTRYIFLNVGYFPRQSFTIVLWQDGINALSKKGITPDVLKGKYISVTGVLTAYNGRPQIIIEQPTQIEILADDDEVKERLTSLGVKKQSTKNIRSTTPDVQIFNELYKNHSSLSSTSSLASSSTARSSTAPQRSERQWTDKEKSELYQKFIANINKNKNVPEDLDSLELERLKTARENLSFSRSNLPKTNMHVQKPKESIKKYSSNRNSNSNSSNNSCIVPIFCAVVGAGLLGSISNGGFWFVGAIIGFFLGSVLQNLFS